MTDTAGGVGICGIQVACTKEVGLEDIVKWMKTKQSDRLVGMGLLLML